MRKKKWRGMTVKGAGAVGCVLLYEQRRISLVM